MRAKALAWLVGAVVFFSGLGLGGAASPITRFSVTPTYSFYPSNIEINFHFAPDPQNTDYCLVWDSGSGGGLGSSCQPVPSSNLGHYLIRRPFPGKYGVILQLYRRNKVAGQAQGFFEVRGDE